MQMVQFEQPTVSVKPSVTPNISLNGTEMTAKLIRYIGFYLYNWMEKTVYRFWKTWKTRGIYFIFPSL